MKAAVTIKKDTMMKPGNDESGWLYITRPAPSYAQVFPEPLSITVSVPDELDNVAVLSEN